MKKLKRMAICGLACAAAAFCQVAAATDAWGLSRVKWVYPLGDGATVIVGFDDESAACTSPQPPGSKYFYISVGANGVTAEGLKNLTAMFLTALATEKVVSYVFDSSSSYCYINRASVAR